MNNFVFGVEVNLIVCGHQLSLILELVFKISLGIYLFAGHFCLFLQKGMTKNGFFGVVSRPNLKLKG